MIKIAAKYGLMCGLISVLSGTIFYTLGLAFKSQWWISSVANILIFVLIIFLVIVAVKEFRKQLEGIITFTEAFTTAISAFIIVALLSSVFNILLYTVIDSEYPEKVKITAIERMEKQLDKSPMEDTKKDEMIEMLDSKDFTYTGPKAVKSFGFTILFYSIISLIIAAAIKKDINEVPLN
ncbi:MAG: DUF4199 domain-containing protein [Bacteroidetes bacterium]|jgi:predicted ferric reductase|nr:DUF4199 domain-containing protein [Bacteroidota bacterium]MBT5528350.1 DUF4199 domain-containing protein [Cytophagia bacterium]MBT3802535.1 DUF4199 domain-containing protein [Bacteroidota bacterium]MBT3933609.1 DUF4199 domain-containing protein [Bacteroidota bacterium]MBT4337901.1 DUF4199 domain-containing protein [Bacteroidota bacterium]